MHQFGVEVFFRDRESSGSGTHVSIMGESNGAAAQPVWVRTDGNMAGNPSISRDGLTVRFWCEDCDATVGMHVVQHKGQTFIRWE